MFSHLPTLQTASALTVISAGDSEAASYAYDRTRTIKDVLVRNARNNTIRAAKRILSFNANVNVYLSFIPGTENSSDLASKAHTNLTEKTNSSFFRSGAKTLLETDFGIDTQFYHVAPNGTETFTSLKNKKEEIKLILDGSAEDRRPGAAPEPIPKEKCDFIYSIIKRFEFLEPAIRALAVMKKITLKMSFKISK